MFAFFQACTLFFSVYLLADVFEEKKKKKKRKKEKFHVSVTAWSLVLA